VNPKDDENTPITKLAPLPYEFQFALPPQAQSQPVQYPMPQTPQQSQAQPQPQAKKLRNLILMIFGILIFAVTPPPIDLVGLGLIVYSLKKYWGKK
jgi:hypothetical protein